MLFNISFLFDIINKQIPMRKGITTIFILILSLQIFVTNSIAQTCNPNEFQSENNLETSSYPTCYPITNTLCLANGYCACKAGYFGNCIYSGEILNLQTMTSVNISEQMKYFIIVPTLKQDHHEIAFKIMISTNFMEPNMTKTLININFWIDNDQLDQPTLMNSIDDQETTMKLKYGSNRYLTQEYKFKKKHSGQSSQFIIGISLANREFFSNSSSLNTTQNSIMSLPIGITYSQIQEQQDEQFQFLTVILVVFAIIVLGILVQCFYFKKKHIMKSAQKSQQNLHSQEMSNVLIKKDEIQKENGLHQYVDPNPDKSFLRMEQSAPPMQKRMSKQQFRRQFLSQEIK